MVASGTSTPTSITVVATRSGAAPEANSRIRSSFSSAPIRPCRVPICTPASCGSAASRSAVSSTEASSEASPSAGLGAVLCSALGAGPSASSPMRGQTTYTRPPASISSRARCQARAIHGPFCDGTRVVEIRSSAGRFAQSRNLQVAKDRHG